MSSCNIGLMAIRWSYCREACRVLFSLYFWGDVIQLLDFAFLIIYGCMHCPDVDVGDYPFFQNKNQID